jgi:hypothetical protein
LKSGIAAAAYCPWIDYNINSQLNRFTYSNGDVVHNGAPVNLGLLNEKWESIALLPVDGGFDKRDDDKSDSQDYYLFTVSDNDFITDKGQFACPSVLVLISTRGRV